MCNQFYRLFCYITNIIILFSLSLSLPVCLSVSHLNYIIEAFFVINYFKATTPFLSYLLLFNHLVGVFTDTVCFLVRNSLLIHINRSAFTHSPISASHLRLPPQRILCPRLRLNCSFRFIVAHHTPSVLCHFVSTNRETNKHFEQEKETKTCQISTIEGLKKKPN